MCMHISVHKRPMQDEVRGRLRYKNGAAGVNGIDLLSANLSSFREAIRQSSTGPSLSAMRSS